MHDELTKVDIKKMQDEIDYRTGVLRPELIKAVQAARALGDLSENFEYSSAKRELGRNNSRIIYLQQMIATAKVIEDNSAEDTAGLFDTLVLYYESEDEERTIKLVTTLRQDVLEGLISKESPLGKALLGHKVGDRVCVKVSDERKYYVTIKKITKGEDDESLPISPY